MAWMQNQLYVKKQNTLMVLDLIAQVRRSGIDYTREDHGIGSCPQCGFDYLEQKWWDRQGERFADDR